MLLGIWSTAHLLFVGIGNDFFGQLFCWDVDGCSALYALVIMNTMMLMSIPMSSHGSLLRL
jgi:hypothetical protein